MTEIRAYLESRSKEELVGVLLERARSDDELERELLARAARTEGRSLRFGPFLAAFDEAACWDGEFVGHEESFEYVSRLGKVVDRYEWLLKEGHATAVIRLTERALTTMEHRMESVDDSYGNVSDVTTRLQNLHHEACRVAPPDPEVLARWVFDWRYATEYGLLRDAPGPYTDVLGKKGLAVYAALTLHPKESSGCPCGHLKGTGWEAFRWPEET